MRPCWICILVFLTLACAFPLKTRNTLDNGSGGDLEQDIYNEALDDIALDPNIADALDAYDAALNDTAEDIDAVDADAAEANAIDDSGTGADAGIDADDTTNGTLDDTDVTKDTTTEATYAVKTDVQNDSDADIVADKKSPVNPPPPVIAVVYVPKPLPEAYGSPNVVAETPLSGKPLTNIPIAAPPTVVPVNAVPVAIPVPPAPAPAPAPAPITVSIPAPVPVTAPDNYLTDTSIPPPAAPGQLPDHQSQTGQPQGPEDENNTSQSNADGETKGSNPLGGLLQGLSDGINGLFQGLHGIAATDKNNSAPEDDPSPVEQPLAPE
ncbi:hypothetical protein GGI11_006460 [Coemansia sp. RSA 2049]|nr:hypothetical protein GGI11_006460 [Coemansia sp. RSA 2049]